MFIPGHIPTQRCQFNTKKEGLSGEIHGLSCISRSSHLCYLDAILGKEQVSDISTGAFVPPMRRFVACRGHPSNIYSDNGTIFVGTSHALQEVYNIFNQQSTPNLCVVTVRQSPSCIPNLGGLWEAKVKSQETSRDSVKISLYLIYLMCSTVYICFV